MPTPTSEGRPLAAGAGLGELYRSHRWSLVRLASLLLHDSGDAEEIVQDAFVNAHRRWDRLRDDDKALAYVRSAVLNGARSRLRHLRVVERDRPLHRADTPSAEASAIANDDHRVVIDALRVLPTRQRECLALRYYLDLSEAEIAGGPGPTSPTGPSPTTSAPPATTVTSAPPTSVPTTTSAPPVPFRHQPLWPFRSQQEADAWRADYRAGGHQPWHLDPAQTALTFSSGYLGYTEIDRVVGRTVDGSEARIAVGFETNPGAFSTAAVVHLFRFGTGDDAPWEVVGTEDTTLSLTSPRYGATVSSPFTAGGRITGVDENIRVQVRQPSTTGPIGERCCVPAGGTSSPWTATVPFQGATDPVLTVAASTGGHLKAVERFAVTGVRAPQA